MNIIAGRARGRRLKTLPGDATRPTSGKVRGALFSILQAWVEEASWLDLYAGSGAIGLEAVSRGAKRAVLVERAPAAVAVIRENLEATKLPSVELLPIEAEGALARLAGERFDVVFLDPPYRDDPMPVVEAIARHDLLVPDGRVVVEHRSDRRLPEQAGGLVKIRTACYAESCLSFYRWPAEAESGDTSAS